MALATVPTSGLMAMEQSSPFEGMSDSVGDVTMAPALLPSGYQANWHFLGFRPTDRTPRFGGVPERYLRDLSGTSLGEMTMAVQDAVLDLSRSRQPSQAMMTMWPSPPPQERRLQSAVELDRAEISFDETAASVLGRLYDLGHASVSDLADWFQSPDQWVAFSRLQRCRYIEDLGSHFTLSRDGREFVEEMLAVDIVE